MYIYVYIYTYIYIYIHICHYLEERPYHWIGIKVSVFAVSCSTGLLSTSTITERTRHPTLARLVPRKTIHGETAYYYI